MTLVTVTRVERLDVPGPVRRALGKLDRRLRALAAERALGTALVIAAVGAAVGMAADFGWGLDREARWAIWGAWIGATLAPLAIASARGLARKSRALELAAVLERGHPEMGERLTGAVGLLAGDGPAHGSPALIAALADDASALARAIHPSRSVSGRAARRRLALGLLAAAVVAAPAVLQPDPFRRLATRFLAPWAEAGRVGLFAVTVAPGDAVAALGDDLTITARVAPRYGRIPVRGGAWLEWSDAATGRTRRVAMGEGTNPPSAGMAPPKTGERVFSLVLPRLASSMTYRVASGSGESPRHQITAVARPAVVLVSARVEPPSYTRRPAAIARDPARITAWEDSRVTLTVATTTPIRSAEVTWPRAVAVADVEGEKTKAKVESKRVAAVVAADGRSASVALAADASGEYAIALCDVHGLSGRPEPARRVVIQPDEPPVVAIRGGDAIEEARADDTLRAGLAARDDVAVASAELHYAVERAATSANDDPKADSGQVAATLPGLGTRSARGDAVLSLRSLRLRPGDVVSYRARVTDNRPAPRGPNVAWSPTRRLRVVAKADPIWAQRDKAGRESIQAKLDALKKAAAENRRQTEQLRYAADAAQRGNGEWDRDRRRELSRRESEARAVGDGLEALARDLAAEPAFRPLERPARQAAKVEAEAARATLDQARQADDAAERLADLRQADSRLGAVSARIEELQRDFNALAEREADRRRLQDLADRQARVADKAEADAPRDRARLDQLAAEQNAVKNDLEALLKKAPELRADVLAAQADEADALARRARALADHQRVEARQATDLSKKAETLKALAEEQRAIEDDARRLAVDVNTPLVENQRAPLNTDPIRQAVEPIERGDLDQGRQRLGAAEAELRRIARDLEDAPGDLKAFAARLARRQEELTNQIIQALGETRSKNKLPADDRAALAERLKPLVARQKDVAELAAAVLDAKAAKAESKEPRFPREAAVKAAEITARAAAEVARSDNPHEAEHQARAAHAALQRLANELPDAWKRQEPVRKAFSEARRAADDAANDAERHVRETEHLLEREPARAAADLAGKLDHVADRARRAADRFAAIDPEPRLAPQRDRAARRARALADAIDAARAHDHDRPASPAETRALRDAITAAVVGTRAANDRFQQKLDGHVPADDVAAELAEEQHALADAAKENDPGAAADGEKTDAHAGEQQRIATALRALPAPDAPLEQAEAVRHAERAARDGGAEAARRAADALDALANRLADRQSPRKRAEALARAERGLNDPDNPPDPAAEAARQRAVAAELARLAQKSREHPDKDNDKDKDKDNEKNQAGAAAEAVGHAAALAEGALHPERADQPEKPTPARQAEARASAARALDALAAALPDDPPAEPDPEPAAADHPAAPRDADLAIAPAHADQARALAQRERRLKERLRAVLGERVKPQQDLRREAVAVGRDLANLRDRARTLSDRAFSPANDAALNLGQHAPRAMEEAIGELAQGQPDHARNLQRQAAELAERGALNADDLAAALRAEAAANAPPADANAGNHPEPADLAAAREAMNQAGDRLGEARAPDQGPDALAAAREAMRGAADRLQAAAEAKGHGPGEEPPGEGDRQVAQTPASSTPSAAEPQADAAGIADPATLAELQELIRTRTGRRWGELPGHLRSEILQMSRGRYRDDYAHLIQLYFREIAAGADARKETRP